MQYFKNIKLIFILYFIFATSSCVLNLDTNPILYSINPIVVPNKLFSLADNIDEYVKVEGIVKNADSAKVDWYVLDDGSNEEKFIESHIYDLRNKNNYSDSLNNIFYESGTYYCKITFQNKSYSEIGYSNKVKIEREFSNTSLPVLVITTSQKEEIVSKINYINAEFSLKQQDITVTSLKDIKIKARGNSSIFNGKKSYTLNLNEKVQLLNMPSHKKWVLSANYFDRALVRNSYATYLGTQVFDNMKWNPNGKPVSLILNGQYRGIYYLYEQIRIDKNRVNIKKSDDGKQPFIFEINFRQDDDYNYKTRYGNTVSFSEGNFTDFSSESINNAKNIIQRTEDVIYESNDIHEWEKYIDIDSFIDWYFVNEFTKNIDATWGASVYLYYDPKLEKIFMGPNWDFDISCGNFSENDYECLRINNAGWYTELFKNQEFIQSVKSRWLEKRMDVNNSIEEEINRLKNEISVDVDYNFKRWPVLGTVLWPAAPGCENRSTFDSEIEYLKVWLKKRYFWYDMAIQNL